MICTTWCQIKWEVILGIQIFYSFSCFAGIVLEQIPDLCHCLYSFQIGCKTLCSLSLLRNLLELNLFHD